MTACHGVYSGMTIMRCLNGGSVNMKKFGTAAASAAVLILTGAGGAYAADLGTMPTKALVPAGPAVCTGFLDFITTACQLSAYGVRLYGTIDVGATYETHGAKDDPNLGV